MTSSVTIRVAVRRFRVKSTYRLAILTEEFTPDAPQVIAVGTSRQCRVGTPTRGTFNELFGDFMSFLPFLSHLLIVENKARSAHLDELQDS